MINVLDHLLKFLQANAGINDKVILTKLVADNFALTRDRSVYYCDEFAIRFSTAASQNFSNTVLSLSNLQKFDDRPFIVCLVTPLDNHLYLANTSFLKKISHSSQQLRENNIRGSFNGSDIVRYFEGMANSPKNFDRLFNIHAGVGFEGNLVRLVEATNNISPSGRKFIVADAALIQILNAPLRAQRFVLSKEVVTLKRELDEKVEQFKSEILLAAFIENVNVRGRIIEYLIAGEDERLKTELVAALRAGDRGIPVFKTQNSLSDYTRVFESLLTATDIKTKVMVLDSNPKAYNLDKVLEFLASDHTVFMFYFIGVEPVRIIDTVLVSMFQKTLLRSTVLLKHWAGRNSRGVSQFEGKAVSKLILEPDDGINIDDAIEFLRKLVAL